MQKVLICCTFVLSGLVGIAHSQDPLGNNSSGPSALYAGAVGEHVGYGGTAERNKEIIVWCILPTKPSTEDSNSALFTRSSLAGFAFAYLQADQYAGQHVFRIILIRDTCSVPLVRAASIACVNVPVDSQCAVELVVEEWYAILRLSWQLLKPWRLIMSKCPPGTNCAQGNCICATPCDGSCSIIVAPAAMPAWMAKGAVISSVDLLLEVMTVDNVEIYAPVAQNVQEMHVSVPAVDWLLAMDNAARLVNFAAVESARTYSVIGTTVGIAGLSARQVQTASMVSVSAIFQARPLVMEHVVRLACWAAAVTHVLTFKVMDRIADDAAILWLILPLSVLVLRSTTLQAS
ncbi:hypothetical protein Y699_08792 [Aspergillus fumigatus Z5]|nr:hypothetical protein Y699_08792 [Aspergillus fumigatus Z5]